MDARFRLPLASALLLGGLVVAALFWTDGGRPREELGPGVRRVAEPEGESTPNAALVAPRHPSDAGRGASRGPSTVLFPLEVHLELVERRDLPEVPTGPPLGSGRRARLVGRLADGAGQPAQATIQFVAGPNQGRVLATDPTGRFGGADFYPGIDVVEVRGPRILGSRREVRLAEGKETLLNVGYGRPGSVAGRVVDEGGQPVEGASVTVDGQGGISGPNGFFSIAQVAAGPVLLEVERDGFAPHRQEIGVPLGGAIAATQLTVILTTGATLELVLRNDVGGPGPALVHLEPATTEYERRYNWSRLGAVEVGRDPVLLKNLPPGPVLVRVHREGAHGVPPTRQVHLPRAGSARAELELRAAPRIEVAVQREGRVVPGVSLRLSAADVPRASAAFGGELSATRDDEVRRLHASVWQEATSDSSGRAVFTSYEELSPFRLLEALDQDGKVLAQRAVGPSESQVDLDLGGEAPGGLLGRIRFAARGRIQELPVEVVVDSVPRLAKVLPPEDELIVDGLVPGRWRAEVRWWGIPVLSPRVVDVGIGVVDVDLVLPEGAILGQDEDAWRRAGRDYPLR